VFALFSSLESLLVVAVCLRYEQAIVIADDEENAANLLGLSLLVAAGLTTLATFGAFIFADPLASSLGMDELRPYLLLLALALAGDAAYQTFNYWSVRRRDYAQVARTKVSQGVAQSLGQIVLGVLGTGPGGLLGGWTLGRLAGTLRMARTAVHAGVVRHVSLEGMARAARGSKRFPTLALPAGLLNTASLQAPGLLLAVIYDFRVAGLYLLANRVVTVPMILLGQSFSQALMGRLSPSSEDASPDPCAALVRRAVLTMVALAALPALVLVLAGPNLFAFAFGQQWRQAGVFAQLLAPAFVAQLSVSPVAWVLTARNRQAWQLAWDAIRLVLVLAALLIPAALGAGGAASVAGYSNVLVVTYGVLLAMVLSAANDTGPASPEPPGTFAVAAGRVP
jgi:O-antigen/teichoic acid export membrane protein